MSNFQVEPNFYVDRLCVHDVMVLLLERQGKILVKKCE